MALAAGLEVVVDGLVQGPDDRWRCWWPGDDAEYLAYHDTEWGVPVHDEHRLFEKICLEGFQAGLSWLTILRRRPVLREVFHGFDPARVAAFDDGDVARLLHDARIIRHRGKIEATIANARCVVDMAGRGESFAELVWSFAPVPTPPRPASIDQVPATTPESTALARELRRRGFRFVGPTTAYAFMQSMGLVDDHLVGCQVSGVTG